MTDIEVPAQRDGETTALPAWIHNPYWTTSQACAFVAAVRDITPESARRWLGRHATAISREPGRDGENRYSSFRIKRDAPVNADGTLGADAVSTAELYHD